MTYIDLRHCYSAGDVTLHYIIYYIISYYILYHTIYCIVLYYIIL